MRRCLVSFVSLMLFAACGGSDPVPPPTACTAGSSNPCTCSDGRAGAQTCNAAGSGYGACSCGSPVDAGCASENGAVACNRFMGTFCARIIMCCDASVDPCVDWTIDDPSCRAHFVEVGYDCSSPMVTGTTNCTADVDRCIGDIPLIACSDIVAGTANPPASCASL